HETLVFLFRRVGRMHVGGAVVDRDLVGELPRGAVVLIGELELADDAAGIAHTHHRRGRGKLDALTAGHVFAIEFGVFHREPAAGNHPLRETFDAEAVEAVDVAAVEVAGGIADLLHAGDEMVGMAEVAVGVRLWQIFVLDRIAHRVGPAVRGIGRVIPIDAAEGGTHGRRLARPVAARDFARHAAGGGEHRVTGGIDERLGAYVAQPLDVADDRAANAVAGSIGIDHAGEIPDLHAGIDAIVVEQPLETLRIERNPAVV